MHHQQQHQHQLASLLAAALPKDSAATSSSAAGTPGRKGGSDDDEKEDSARLSAVNSLHRAILYPPNSLLVAQSASFLSQGLSQLLSDKLYSVRQSAATAYGALCAVISSVPIGSNGRPNPIVLGSLVDRFINWSLPLLSNVNAGDGTAELAVEGLREFLSAGDVAGVERYVFAILKACQVLLEDERTSFSLLHRLLGVLTLISMKFYGFFQPHFLDVIDLLLGWALVPDLPESDRRVVLDSFLQFQKHWVVNLQFSLGLLSKFLGDMDVLLRDVGHGTSQQLRRLLALLSCFSTVLQSTASGLLEMNLLEQITETLIVMLPQLMQCLSLVGKKFGWSKWREDCWKCLTLLAEILGEKFSAFYALAVDILFQSLQVNSTAQAGTEKITSFEVHGVLKTNLQLLSLQKLGLLTSAVPKILHFDAPVSQLRLHPNHLVTGSSAATYIFLLQHGNDEIVQEAINVLIDELEHLKGLIEKSFDLENGTKLQTDSKPYLRVESSALLKFDLKVLLTCVSLGGLSSLMGQPDIASIYVKRSEKLAAVLIEKLDPFDLPIRMSVEMQVNVIRTLERLTSVELLGKWSIRNQDSEKISRDVAAGEGCMVKTLKDGHSSVLVEHIWKYGCFLVEALHISAPMAVKLVALEWIQQFSNTFLTINDNTRSNYFEASGHISGFRNILFSVLDATFDREPKVRSHAVLVLEMLLRARLISPLYFNLVAEIVLERTSDPDGEIRDAVIRLFSFVLPSTMYYCGVYDSRITNHCRHSAIASCHGSDLHWKQVFALRQQKQHLHSQLLVSVLSYISQRWKVPLSSWIYRLVHDCRGPKDQLDEEGKFGDILWDVKVDEDLLEKIAGVNYLAAAWWAIHEAARYCITTRLRTNLGGPTQTFAALERMLLDISHVLQLDVEQNDGNLSIIGSSGAHLLPMRLLLDFVEALKKNVYNAYEGSAILCSAPRQSSLFFRANRKVCEEWFSRICEPMMNAGLALQCHDATIQYCSVRLQELKSLWASSLKDKTRGQVSENIQNFRDRIFGDILRVLRHMALALCKNHEPEALDGLQQWVSMTFLPFLVDEHWSPSQSGKLGPFAWITGLVHQAEGQYERAAAYFIHLLQSDDSLSSMGSDGVQFAIARIIESYTSLSDWRSLDSWLQHLQSLRAKHAGKSYCGALTTAGNEINAIHALARFDEGDFQAAWTFLDLTPTSSSELTLDPKLAMQRSEQMLLQAMLLHAEGKVDTVPGEIQKAKAMLEELLSVLPLDGLPEAAPYAAQLHCIYAFEEACKLKGNREKLMQCQSVLNAYVQSVHSCLNKGYRDCTPWLKVLRVYQTTYPTSVISLKFCLNVSNLARKQGNFMLATRLNGLLRDRVMNLPEERDKELLSTDLQYEEILLMHSQNKLEDAFDNLWSFIRPSMVSSVSVCHRSDDNILRAKACLKLSRWLRKCYPDLNLEDFALKILADLGVDNASLLSSRSLDDVKNVTSRLNLPDFIEELGGTAVKLSTQLCPTMSKSWNSYASWCFNHGRNSILTTDEPSLVSYSFSPLLSEEVLPERFKLTADERIRVRSVVLQLFGRDNTNDLGENSKLCLDSAECLINDHAIKALVQQIIAVIETAAGSPGAESSDGESLSVSVASTLRTSFESIVGLEETCLISAVDSLVDVWWSLRKRRVSLFGHAAHGFMQCLRYASAKLADGLLSDPECEVLNQSASSRMLRATLYLLHILLNYGVELNDTIECALSTVPLPPWQEITPQLFARLSSHPEKVVRKQLEALLMMLAKVSPHSIVFPTLVDIKANEKPSEELQHILGCLRQLYPKLIQDVQLMINELENVTVLWEELWLSTIQDLHADVIRRINVLKEEAVRTAENATLSESEKYKINAAKYSAMMAPIVLALERRLASTSRKPETPHEIWFCEEYRERLRSAILTFKTPPAPDALGEVWHPFEDIATSLASYQRKSSVSLGEVAPQLAQLSSSDVPMPGLEKQVPLSEANGNTSTTLQGIVTVASFSEQVTVLSTKTKPKKLVIIGSDGNKYTYLLKGREDLRLDARIMQLLQAINGFMHSPAVKCQNLLTIHFYSVTPISGRAGLIQWVENVVSIYSVFKSWQTRTQVAQLSPIGPGDTRNSVPLPVPRPSDMFYGKIIPALKEKGIRRVISRRDWPHDVKRKVLLDLMKEVPRQLLHQELWCASEGFKAFSLKLNRYSGSVAAMSMVGHILGLGDRHLDNILVDFCSGEIVHIDYNICFDKGQRLKIPEIVPFRLTQVVEGALGLTGVEGTFRANCETVIGVLRKNKDILLMLLEVFVWDPLVEWTRGDFHDDAAIVGEERKGMELAVSLSLFASRVQEIRVPLQEHHDLLLETLPAIESALERFADLLNQYELASALFFQADEERSNLIVHETSAKSIVAEATSNSEKSRASFEFQAREFAQAKALVAEKAQEAATWMEQHGRVLDALRRNLLPELKFSLNLSSMVDSLSLTSAVLVAGVPLTIVPEPTLAQCQDIDREILKLMADLDHGLLSALSGIETYSLILQRILPLNYLATSSVHDWAQVLQLSANAPSSDALSLARLRAAEIVAEVRKDDIDSVKQTYHNLCLRVEKYATEIEKVEKECAELVNSVGLENETIAKDRLLSSFVKYMQSAGLVGTGQNINEANQGTRLHGDSDKRRDKVLSVLNMAVSSLYDENKQRVLKILSDHGGIENATGAFGAIFCEFEEQVEKCILICAFVDELEQLIAKDMSGVDANIYNPSQDMFPSLVKSILISCKNLIEQMTETVLVDVMHSAVSSKSEVMDAFGLISQIRGSIDMALERILEVEFEKASLVELEKNYFVNVGVITEKQLALEEAAMKGRDHLSWEEAEELASQEEACRAQLDELHQTWNQREVRTSSLIKAEADAKSALVSCELHFNSLVSSEEPSDPNVSGSKALLSSLVNPFSELESLHRELLTFDGGFNVLHSHQVPNLLELMSSGNSLSENIWKFGGLLNNQPFFIWKVCIVDSFFDFCARDSASSLDQSLGFDQLSNVVKKKLEMQIQEHIGRYLKEWLVPTFLAWLDKEIEHLKQLTEVMKDHPLDQARKDAVLVRKVLLMIEEYCNAHETVRAARSAASGMKRQVNELKEALRKTSLEIVQLEWMHDALIPSPGNRIYLQNMLTSQDSLHSIILNLSRTKLLENIQSAVKKMASSLDFLKSCERNCITAEGQLERAMIWACGAQSSNATGNSSTKSSGIPLEFHEHLMRRRQLLWEAREKASDVIKTCLLIIEFEASRDGIYHIPGEPFPSRTIGDGRSWQQAYLNALTMLEVNFHSLTRAEQDWQLAESNLEAASSSLYSAANELSIASIKAKSASGDLQSIVLAMRGSAYETSVALSAFGRMSRDHTALTSESGTMLEEVLAITEDMHDVHKLGREAAALHHSLMEDLSKANAFLLPLETLLSKDVPAMNDAMNREVEIRVEVYLIHGQAIYQSYCLRIREAFQMFKPLVPSLTSTVKGLHSMLMKLARTASLHAGNLHTALEGLAESQEVKSQEVGLDISDGDSQFDEKRKESLSNSENFSGEDFLKGVGPSLEDKGWISPPDSVYSGSSESGIASSEVSITDTLNSLAEVGIGSSSEVVTDGVNLGPSSRSYHLENSIYEELISCDVSGNVIGTNDPIAPFEAVTSPSAELVHFDESLHHLDENRHECEGKDDEGSSSSKMKNEDVVPPLPNMHSATHVARGKFQGKNAYALSVLRRVEMKIDGRDVSDKREIGIREQVDYLLKQAMSVDNLCNMYEGWTPWI